MMVHPNLCVHGREHCHDIKEQQKMGFGNFVSRFNMRNWYSQLTDDPVFAQILLDRC